VGFLRKLRHYASAIMYGLVTSGKLWQFLKLEGQTVTIDPEEYAIPPLAIRREAPRSTCTQVSVGMRGA
jgi:hypothetical protein